jgi:hypothetical protein
MCGFKIRDALVGAQESGLALSLQMGTPDYREVAE